MSRDTLVADLLALTPKQLKKLAEGPKKIEEAAPQPLPAIQVKKTAEPLPYLGEIGRYFRGVFVKEKS
jgi:hypothetical protein